jgi:hypothetical protein
MRSTPPDSDVPVVIPEWVAKHFREYGGRLRHTPPSLDPNAIPVRDTYDDPIVPGRGKTVPLSRQERRENMIYMDINNPDIYDLIDLINSWVARQRAMGAIPTFSPTHSDLLQKRENLGTGDGIGTEGQFQDASQNHTIRNRIHARHREFTNRKKTNERKAQKNLPLERRTINETNPNRGTHTRRQQQRGKPTRPEPPR